MNNDKEFITENPFAVLVRRMNRIESQNEEILSFLQTKSGQTSIDEIGGIELAAQVTRLSKDRIYTLVSKRLIPHKKRGNRLTFRRSELLTWLDEGNRAEKKGDEVL